MKVGKKLVALAAASLPLTVPVRAAPEQELTAVVVVEGLASNDLLNIRATASATGVVIGRLPNGSTLRNFGCEKINGYKWCKIIAVDDESLRGWTPARYLQAVADSGPVWEAPVIGKTEPQAGRQADATAKPAPVAAPEAAESPLAAPSIPDSPEILVASLGGVATPELTRADGASDIPPPSPNSGNRVSVPVNLTARLGDTPDAPNDEDAQPFPAFVESNEVVFAFQTAFAAYGMPAIEGRPAPGDEARDKAAPPEPVKVALSATEPLAKPSEPAARLNLQVPMPTLPASAPARASDASGEVPCARYIGQPMTRCGAQAARSGTGAADVTVTFPDGGKRTIRFRKGRPEGSNSRGAFRFSREGDLSMIRVGTSERFEIPDTLPFGD